MKRTINQQLGCKVQRVNEEVVNHESEQDTQLATFVDDIGDNYKQVADSSLNIDENYQANVLTKTNVKQLKEQNIHMVLEDERLTKQLHSVPMLRQDAELFSNSSYVISAGTQNSTGQNVIVHSERENSNIVIQDSSVVKTDPETTPTVYPPVYISAVPCLNATISPMIRPQISQQDEPKTIKQEDEILSVTVEQAREQANVIQDEKLEHQILKRNLEHSVRQSAVQQEVINQLEIQGGNDVELHHQPNEKLVFARQLSDLQHVVTSQPLTQQITMDHPQAISHIQQQIAGNNLPKSATLLQPNNVIIQTPAQYNTVYVSQNNSQAEPKLVQQHISILSQDVLPAVGSQSNIGTDQTLIQSMHHPSIVHGNTATHVLSTTANLPRGMSQNVVLKSDGNLQNRQLSHLKLQQEPNFNLQQLSNVASMQLNDKTQVEGTVQMRNLVVTSQVGSTSIGNVQFANSHLKTVPTVASSHLETSTIRGIQHVTDQQGIHVINQSGNTKIKRHLSSAQLRNPHLVSPRIEKVQVTSQQTVLQQSALQHSALPQNVLQQNVLQHNVLQQNVLQQNVLQQNVLQHNILQQSALQLQHNALQQNKQQTTQQTFKYPQALQHTTVQPECYTKSVVVNIPNQITKQHTLRINTPASIKSVKKSPAIQSFAQHGIQIIPSRVQTVGRSTAKSSGLMIDTSKGQTHISQQQHNVLVHSPNTQIIKPVVPTVQMMPRNQIPTVVGEKTYTDQSTSHIDDSKAQLDNKMFLENDEQQVILEQPSNNQLVMVQNSLLSQEVLPIDVKVRKY